MRDLKQIIIHHTATPHHMDIGVKELRHWHVEDNGWLDVGYHFVIRQDGTIEPGRPVQTSGAHARGHNTHSVGIVLVGTGPNFTRHQWNALNEQVILLTAQYDITQILGHNDVGNTACPGFDVSVWWNA